jgi:hypothetical protein
MTLEYDPALDGWWFETPTGRRVLKDPDGPPTGRQLLRLAHLGLLEIRAEPGRPLSKLDCARAIDYHERNL